MGNYLFIISFHLKKIKVYNRLLNIDIFEPFTKERDIYLANSIKNCYGNTIVAVVGASHLKGKKNFFFYQYYFLIRNY